jgi:hypothetical protein
LSGQQTEKYESLVGTYINPCVAPHNDTTEDLKVKDATSGPRASPTAPIDNWYISALNHRVKHILVTWSMRIGRRYHIKMQTRITQMAAGLLMAPIIPISMRIVVKLQIPNVRRVLRPNFSIK